MTYFEQLVLNCDVKSFCETLVMKAKNISLSFQHEFYKIRICKKTSIKSSPSLLKRDFVRNQYSISRLETQITSLIGHENRGELKLNGKFEILNEEKNNPLLYGIN